MSNYSAGPWKVVDGVKEVGVLHRNRFAIRSFSKRIPNPDGFLLASVGYRPNANLMAAAPKLLAALKRVVERELDLDPESRNYHDSEIKAWERLIKKAGGNNVKAC